jgi:hypothetical protein
MDKLSRLLEENSQMNKLLKTNIYLNHDTNLYLEMVNLNKTNLDTLNNVSILLN